MSARRLQVFDWVTGSVAKLAIGHNKTGRGERPVAFTPGRAAGTRKGWGRGEAVQVTDRDHENARRLAASWNLLRHVPLIDLERMLEQKEDTDE